MNEQVRLQRYLPLIRACAGWTAQDLADRLEVSRQSISAWENYDFKNGEKGVKLSRIQYLAIRKLLDDEIAKDVKQVSKGKEHILGTLLEVLVDHPDEYTSEDKKAVISEAKLLAPSIVKQPQQRKAISDIWPAVLMGCGVVLSATILAIIGHEGKRGVDKIARKN